MSFHAGQKSIPDRAKLAAGKKPYGARSCAGVVRGEPDPERRHSRCVVAQQVSTQFAWLWMLDYMLIVMSYIGTKSAKTSDLPGLESC